MFTLKKLPLIPTLLVIFFVVLMTNMGFWQLRRAEQKTELLSLLSNDEVTTIQRKSEVKDLPRYAHVVLQGRYLPAHHLLLDNQLHEKKIGYHVFTPFKLSNNLNMIIMVNRGWVAKQGFEASMLDIDESDRTIHARLNEPPKVGVQLGEISMDNTQDTQLITYYDEQIINRYLHESLCDRLDCVISDRIVWLSGDQKNSNNGGFIRAWKPVIMPPSKHIAYAVQWFSMTVVLMIVFGLWLRKVGFKSIE